MKLELAQDVRTILSHRYRMFKMRCQTATPGDGCPSILFNLDLVSSGVDHRLDCQDHTLFESKAPVRLAVVRNRRFLMQVFPNPVTHKGPHHGKAPVLDGLLNHRSEIA